MKILVTLSTFAQCGDKPLELLQSSGHDYVINDLGRRFKEEDIISYGKDCDGIVAGVEPYTKEVLDQLPQLKCISRCGVGIDSIDLDYAKSKDIAICNTPDVVIQPVAELTVAMAFDVLRKLTQHTQKLHSKEWVKYTGYLLQGKTVGILGLGRIGRRAAELFSALGANVLGTDLYPDHDWAKRHHVKIVELNDLLKQSEVLSIHLSTHTEHPFELTAKEMALMPKGAMLINVARGSFVNENDLYDALHSGHLEAAALDVFPEEPYSGKLCELDNVIMTPHVATLTKESRLQMETESVQNLIDRLSQ